MQKRTKIVATIGPTCDSYVMIEKLIKAGVNVFRFNFKHNTIEWHNERIKRVNQTAKKLKMTIGTLIDLQGPEVRINMGSLDELSIKKDELLLFGEECLKSKDPGFSISHPQIISHLEDGQKIVADNGVFNFIVERKNRKTYLRSMSEGRLLNHKSMNIPGADFPFPVLVDRDLEGLKLAAGNEVDFVALSFVRSSADIEKLRSEMKKYDLDARIIAKIETKKALDHLPGIVRVSDGIMVARGDLGVELPIEEVPYYQKTIIKEAIRQSKPVITATQMLQSMIENPYPSRAEISDIANATYDLTDAVMLSGETALGSYPLESVEMMSKTIAFNEVQNKVDSRLRFKFELNDRVEMLCDSAYGLYRLYQEKFENLAGFLIFTHTGKTALMLSRYRPQLPMFAFTPSDEVADTLSLSYGIVPLSHDVAREKEITSREIRTAVYHLLELKAVKKGQALIVLYGDYWAEAGGTSSIKLITV